MTTHTPRKLGRPSKGPRDLVRVRLHPDLKAAVVDAAKSRGLDTNTYITHLIAMSTGLTELVPGGIRVTFDELIAHEGEPARQSA